MIDRDLLYQELKNEQRQEIVEDFEYENNMRYDVEFFCEEVVNMSVYPKHMTVDATDILVAIKQMCNAYNQNIDDVLDYMKTI